MQIFFIIGAAILAFISGNLVVNKIEMIFPVPTPIIIQKEPTPITPEYIQPTSVQKVYVPTSTTIPQQPQVIQQNISNIDCTGPDGKHFKTSQQECDKFNASWGKPQQNNIAPPISQGTTQSTSSSQPLVICVLSYGTYQLTQSSCDSFKNSDKQYTSSQYYPCTLYYPALKISSTYNSLYKTKEECDGAQQNLNQSGTNSNSGQTQQPTTVPDNSYNQQQNGQCKMYANQWYTNQGTQCSGSCAEAVKQIAYPQYQQKLKDCDSLYPI